MVHPFCEKKEHLLAAYMEAVHTHADTVGLLKAVRDQPKAFWSALRIPGHVNKRSGKL